MADVDRMYSIRAKLNKVDLFAIKYSKICTIILLPFLGLLLLMAFLFFDEFINVGVLGNIDGYPWGCKCFPGMENYASPERYAFSSIEGGLILIAMSAFAGIAMLKKRAFYILLVLLPYLSLSILIVIATILTGGSLL